MKKSTQKRLVWNWRHNAAWATLRRAAAFIQHISHVPSVLPAHQSEVIRLMWELRFLADKIRQERLNENGTISTLPLPQKGDAEE